jgi:Transmembrane secretion effector
VWGALTERLGERAALSVATVASVCGLATLWRWPLHAVQHFDLSPFQQWAEPMLVRIPDPEDGPVLIAVEYRVSTERASDFSPGSCCSHLGACDQRPGRSTDPWPGAPSPFWR